MAEYGDKSIVGPDLGLGATGRRTQPKISPGDHGEIKAALALDRESGSLILDFGHPVTWIAMTRGEALALAAALTDKASQLPE
jgi:hypothetical protein